jgi:PAS domain S-box-containing protein
MGARTAFLRTGMRARLNGAPVHLRLLLAFALVLALCAAQSIFAYMSALDDVAADAAQYRSEQIEKSASETGDILLEMEAGYRGYLLTGDEGMLADYRTAALAFSTDLARLQVVSADDQDKLIRWRSLERRVAVWQSEILEPGIAHRQAATQGGFDPSSVSNSLAAMSQQDIVGIQLLLDTAIAAEQTALARSHVATTESNDRLMAVLLWGTLAVLGVGVAVAGFSAWSLARAISRVHASDRRFRQMFGNNPAIKVLVDSRTGDFVEANDAACEFYGYPRAELLRLSIMSVSTHAPADIAEAMARMAAGLQSTFGSRHRLASGELRDIEIQASHVDDDETGRVLVYCVVHDITQRKRAEVDLAASEERNRLALQAAGMGTWDVDFVRGVHTWSVETEALFGLLPGTFEGNFAAFQRMVDPRDWAVLESEDRAAKAEHRDSLTTYRSVWPDGSLHWIEEKGRPGYAPDGSVARMTGTSMDVTERKLAEEALRASEERFRNQYKGVPVPTYTWLQVGDDFIMQDYNDAAEAIAEDDVRGWIGVRAADRYASQPEILADIQECVTEHRTLHHQLRFRYPSGRERELALTYVFVPPQTVMLHSEDITELKLAEQQRDAMAQSEKLRALGQMATGIAHDLNQSLMLVASYSDLARQALVQDPPNLAELEDLLTTTTQAALDGGVTVKRLLLFTRAAPDHDVQPVDLATIARETAQLTAPRWRDAAQAEGRPISLHVEAEDHPIIQGSPAQLRELMTNLIFNAVDAMPTGGTIRLQVLTENGQGIIEVADSGVGMSAEVQERVFEPFFTTKGEGGTGLGLAMVFGIVEQHRGQIDVRSAIGQGTTFRITLPLANEAVGDGVARVAASDGEPPHPLRVLVVDDEPMMTRAVARMLKPVGHAVTVAASGEEALDTLAGHPFDVVVSDMGMGAGMNGWELAEAVKRRWPDIRFLLATGWGAAIDPAEARARGVEAVLAKPYHPLDLIHALAVRTLAA